MEDFGKFMFSIMLVCMGMLVDAWIISCFWSWFICPAFGVTTITLGQAAGLAMVKGYLFLRKGDLTNEPKGYKERVIDVFTAMFMTLLLLGLGFILSLLIN